MHRFQWIFVVILLSTQLLQSAALAQDEQRPTELRFSYLLDELNPKPFERPPSTDRDIILECLKYQETYREAIELVVDRIPDDQILAQRVRDFLKTVYVSDSDGNFAYDYVAQDYFVLLSELQQIEKHREFVSKLYFEIADFGCFDELEVALAKLGRDPQFRADVYKILKEQFNQSDNLVTRWAMSQIAPDESKDPVPHMIEKLLASTTVEELDQLKYFFFELVPIEQEHIALAVNVIRVGSDEKIEIIAMALRNSHHSYAEQFVGILKNEDEAMQRRMITCLRLMGENSTQIQEAVFQVALANNNSKIRQDAVLYFSWIDAAIPEVISLAKTIVSSTGSSSKTTRELLNAIDILANSQVYEPELVKLIGNQIANEDIEVSNSAFRYLFKKKLTPDFLLPVVINEFKERPGRYLNGLPFYIHGARPQDLLKYYGDRTVPGLIALLDRPDDHLALKTATVILGINPNQFEARRCVERILRKQVDLIKSKNGDCSFNHVRELAIDAWEEFCCDEPGSTELLFEIAELEFQDPKFSYWQSGSIGVLDRHANDVENLQQGLLKLEKNTALSVEKQVLVAKWLGQSKSYSNIARKKLRNILDLDNRNIEAIRALNALGDPSAVDFATAMLDPPRSSSPLGITIGVSRRLLELADVMVELDSDSARQRIHEATRDIDIEKIDSEFDRIGMAAMRLHAQPENIQYQKEFSRWLRSYESRLRSPAVRLCQELGVDAHFAIDEIRKLESDFIPEIRQLAKQAIQAIDDDTP